VIDFSNLLPERLSLVVSEVADGNMALHTGDDPVIVNSNRAAFIEWGLSNPHWLNQIHSTDVVVADGGNDYVASADGLYTSQRQALAILTADCLPVVLANASGSEYAIVHAGWKGLLGGIIENAVGLFESTPVYGVIGPGISQAHYQVDQAFRDRFVDKLGDGASAAFAPDGIGHYKADLKLLARQKLVALGCEKISDVKLCSYANKNLYSFRRNKTIGRFATVVGFG